MTRRYAIYYAPPAGTELSRFGAEWLGRDAETGQTAEPSHMQHITRTMWQDATAAPRLYGFHGTLKPPFRLTPGTDETDMFAALAALGEDQAPVDAGGLRLTQLGRFLALMPEQADGIAALAARCVREMDRFRAAPSPDELARRRAAGLTAAQESLLQRWGYPYVLEEYRFHMTLTDGLDDPAQVRFRDELAGRTQKFIATPLTISDLSVFTQDAPGTPFRLMRRVPLTGT